MAAKPRSESWRAEKARGIVCFKSRNWRNDEAGFASAQLASPALIKSAIIDLNDEAAKRFDLEAVGLSRMTWSTQTSSNTRLKNTYRILTTIMALAALFSVSCASRHHRAIAKLDQSTPRTGGSETTIEPVRQSQPSKSSSSTSGLGLGGAVALTTLAAVSLASTPVVVPMAVVANAGYQVKKKRKERQKEENQRN